MKRIIALILVALMAALLVTGCRHSEYVSYNISKAATNFDVQRRLTVINTRSHQPLLEIVGLMSVQKSDGGVDIIVEVAPNVYKNHYVSLNQWTTYVVEDISGEYVDKHHHEVNILPEKVNPTTLTNDN